MEVGWYGGDRARRMLRRRVTSRWAVARAPARNLDLPLLLATLALAAVGVLMILSATAMRNELGGAPAGQEAVRQLVSLVVAVGAMLAAASVDYRRLRLVSGLLYVAALVLLVLVLTPLGAERNGAQRWIELAGFQLQPSEIAKVAVLLVLAALLDERRTLGDLGVVPLGLVLVAVPTALVFLEPDLGTSVMFLWTALVAFLVGGVGWRWLVGLGVGGVAAVGLALRVGVLHDYQVARLTSFLSAGDADLARTTLYNANQSLIAIGSGGLFGKGLFNGSQTHLAYVPENHTDFIFTVVGEEFGFLGTVAVLGLFALVVWRGLRIAVLARDRFGAVVAACAVALIALQVFVNVGMTVGIMPVTGLPLPFLSFGGTALIANFVLVGLLLNIGMRRFR